MNYNSKYRDIQGTIGFLLLGLLIGGFAPIIAVKREREQFKTTSKLELQDLWRYVLVSGIGAVIQLIIVCVWLRSRKYVRWMARRKGP